MSARATSLDIQKILEATIVSEHGRALFADASAKRKIFQDARTQVSALHKAGDDDAADERAEAKQSHEPSSARRPPVGPLWFASSHGAIGTPTFSTRRPRSSAPP